MSLTEPAVVGYMNSHDGKLYESKESCLFWKPRARALELMTVAEHENIAAPLLKRIAELEEDRDSWVQQASDRTDDAVKFANNYEQAKAMAEKLKQQLDQCRKDAERYRWIRSQPNTFGDYAIDVVQWENDAGSPLRMVALDDAIDAAISKEQNNER